MMNSFTGMECGAKWEWENMEMYDSKPNESSLKKLEITEWGNLEEEEENGSLNLSGSDFGNGSISASTNSSPKHGVLFKQSNLALEPFHYSFGEPYTVDLTGTSSTLNGSEPLMGLKLGKRTYFENCYGNAKSPSSVISGKRSKLIPLGAPIPRCQVDGCNLDLSSAKEYHRKHKVCDTHSKYPKVVIGGIERRFCQQCSRFHSLAEFDDKKRSCRRRLSDHNARRRKPNQESFQFNSSTLPISYYDGWQHMSYGGGNGGNLGYASVYNNNNNNSNSRFTITRASPLNPIKFEHGEAHMMGTQLPQVNGFLALKGGTSQIPVSGMNDTIFSSTVDAAPEYRRALSLLSNYSYTSYEQQSSIVPYVMPYASVEHWPVGVQPSYRGSGGLLEQIPTYEEEFYHHLMN